MRQPEPSDRQQKLGGEQWVATALELERYLEKAAVGVRGTWPRASERTTRC